MGEETIEGYLRRIHRLKEAQKHNKGDNLDYEQAIDFQRAQVGGGTWRCYEQDEIDDYGRRILDIVAMAQYMSMSQGVDVDYWEVDDASPLFRDNLAGLNLSDWAGFVQGVGNGTATTAANIVTLNLGDLKVTPFGGTWRRGYEVGYVTGRVQSEIMALAIPTRALGYAGPARKIVTAGITLNRGLEKATNVVLLGRAGVNLAQDIRAGAFDTETAWSILSVGATAYALAPRVGTKGFKSFPAFKRVKGSPGKGDVWHHIVEQRAANAQRFGAEAIHSTKNIVAVPRDVNQAIANYYSRRRPFTHQKTVRQWLGSKSWQKQYDFGQEILKKILSGAPLP